MTIQKKLLIPVDGSKRTMQTVNYVKDFLPADKNTKIVLFHVFSSIPEEYRELAKDPSWANAALEWRKQALEEKSKTVACLEESKQTLIKGGFSEQSIEIKIHTAEKGVARDIIDEAGRGYTAIVMRRRGMGVLKNIILGSVAVKLLQSLPFLPMIIVGQAPPVKKIVLAMDASPSSRKAVEFVASMLGGQGYEVCIFHAIIGLGAINFELPEVQILEPCIEAFKTKVARLLQDTKELLVASGFEPDKIFQKVISGAHSRSDAIIKQAEEGGYGTIVVGRRGLSRIEAFFMGRVGHKVVYGGKYFSVWVV